MSSPLMRIRSAALYIASFLGIFAAIAFFNERELESDLLGNWFFAVAFTVILAVVGFAILIVIAINVRRVAAKLLHRPLQHSATQPWIVPLVVGAIIVCASLFQSRSAPTLFHHYLGIAIPSSAHDFHYWWDTLPGDSEFVFQFKINPSEFDQLLACRQFVRVTDQNQIDDAIKKAAARIGYRQDLAPPSHESIIYQYESESPSGVPHIVRIYPSDDHGEITIYGDN